MTTLDLGLVKGPQGDPGPIGPQGPPGPEGIISKNLIEIQVLTRAQWNSLGSKSSTVMYVILDE